MGFECHHTKDNVIVLTLWLPETTNKIPPFCRHYVGSCRTPGGSCVRMSLVPPSLTVGVCVGGVCIGVGAIIVRDPQYHTPGPAHTEILVIQERYMSPGRAGRWKLVTGLVEGGEDLHRAVEREALEETGVQAMAEGLCCFRQFHGVQFGCSDLHFVFLLQARSDTVQIDPEELLAARWIDVDEFLAWNQADAGALEIVRASIEAVRQRRPCLAGAQLGGYIGTLFTPPPTSTTCSSRSTS